MNKPYVFNRNYVPRRRPDGSHWRWPVTTVGGRFRIVSDRPWACETDTVSDYFETHAEAIEFALSTLTLGEPTA